jgi:hypothetical protein
MPTALVGTATLPLCFQELCVADADEPYRFIELILSGARLCDDVVPPFLGVVNTGAPAPFASPPDLTADENLVGDTSSAVVESGPLECVAYGCACGAIVCLAGCNVQLFEVDVPDTVPIGEVSWIEAEPGSNCRLDHRHYRRVVVARVMLQIGSDKVVGQTYQPQSWGSDAFFVAYTFHVVTSRSGGPASRIYHSNYEYATYRLARYLHNYN